jgi:hypothetical protein
MLSVGYSALRTAVVAAAVMFGSSAFAATVSCPNSVVTTDREFGLTTDPVAASCLASGSGNINGNNDFINQLGYVSIDKTGNDDAFVGVDGEITITGNSNSGHFTLALPAGYQNFVLVLKSGNGQLDPDWVAFLLAPGTTEGDWTISDQGLSHAILYGQLSTENEKVSENPIPGALWLFGTVIAGGAGYSRWRKKRKQTA